MKSAIQTHTIIVIVLAATVAQAGTLSPPPNWSPMSMLSVTFDTTIKKLSVNDEANMLGAGVYAVLAIDTYTDPNITSGTTSYGRLNSGAAAFGSFDSNQPWGVLNNTAFSRRLGWNPGGSTLQTDIVAAYGTGAGIWIECDPCSKSAGLEAYLAVGKWGVNSAGTLDSNNVPIIDANAQGYSGIFGTAGSSSKWKWDYQMDHNVYAVPLAYISEPNQLFAASYKVYIGDSNGNEILNPDGNSAASLETWIWQGPANVPEPASLALVTAGGLFILRKLRR